MLFLKTIVKTILYKPLYNVLILLVWLIPGHNIAWAIIILTILVRIILLPSSLKATRQQKKMRDLQPEIKALQDKYKDDKQQQAKVLMDYYKEKDINPLGSCLPLLIQLPILIILYYVFRAGLGDQRFDLLYNFTPHVDYIKTVFLGIDLAKPDKWILPIIAGVLQYIQGKQVMPEAPKTPEKGQEMQAMISKQMLYMMPIFTVFIAGRLPAALPLYWIVTNIFSIGQQWWVFRDKSISPIANRISKKGVKNAISNKPYAISKKRGVEVTIRRKSDRK